MNITLDSPKAITIRAAESITTDLVSILSIKDNQGLKTIVAELELGEEKKISLTLWAGQAYDDIGDWTQEQANDRVIELV